MSGRGYTENSIQTIIERIGFSILTRSKNASNRVFAVDCPFCEDTKGHGGFKRVTGFFHCFKCKESRSLWGMAVDNIGKDAAIALYIELEIFAPARFITTDRPVDDVINELLEEIDVATKVIRYGAAAAAPVTVPDTQAAQPLPRDTYFPLERMCTVGRSPDAVNYLARRGVTVISTVFITQHFPFYWFQGPIMDRDRDWRFVDRILVPVYVEGVLLSWTGRAIRSDQRARYMTPKEADTRVVCQHTVYPYDFLKKSTGDMLLIQEGVFDSLPVNLTSQVTGVFGVSVFTNNVTTNQLRWLQSLCGNFKKVVIALDRREYSQSIKVFSYLARHIPNLWGTWTPQKYKDLGEYPLKEVVTELTNLKREVLYG